MIRQLSLILLIGQITLSAQGQAKKSQTLHGEELAKVELDKSLTDTTLHNVVSKNSEIIVDKGTAIKVAEAILFHIYGQKNIEKQKPYEVYKINNYWSLSGTLHKGRLGGTFLIILDAHDCRVVRITHGK